MTTASRRGDIIVEARDLTRQYTLPRERLFQPPEIVHALNGVSFRVAAGGSFGIVGESGCGKSTLARLIMALERPTSGEIRVLGEDVNGLDTGTLRRLRRHFQIVFQDPFGSLDPRQLVDRIVAEPIRALERTIGPAERRERVVGALRAVGLKDSDTAKYPHEFSGGQRQRIAIARALVTRPRLIVADEPVSALDVSVQAQVLNLMKDLQDELDLTYVFISHDLGVIEYVADRIAVMYLGRIVETAPTEVLFRGPAHPYTRALIDAVPKIEAGRRRHRGLRGGVPSAVSLHRGCAFAERCPLAEARCHDEAPVLRYIEADHAVSCHLA